MSESTKKQLASILVNDRAPSRDEFLVSGALAIEQAEIDKVVQCVKSDWIDIRRRVAQFEK